jgi:hypothetical protein
VPAKPLLFNGNREACRTVPQVGWFAALPIGIFTPSTTANEGSST